MGGIGGDGLVFPVSIAFFKFNPQNAISISNFSIMLSSLIRYLLLSKQSHPLKHGKGVLVDYNLSIIMLPAIVSGVSFGGIFI